jgi:hypothetical protein
MLAKCYVCLPGMLQLPPSGMSSLQSELQPIYEQVLRGTTAQASLPDELVLQPLQVMWLEACVKVFANACAASRGNPLLWEAMRANAQGLLQGLPGFSCAVVYCLSMR